LSVGDEGRWAALRSRDFRLFCAARLLSGMALQMQTVAVGWLIYELTQSAWALGLVGLAAFTPAVAFALPAGHVADSFDRRVALIAAHAVTALGALGLLLFVFSGTGEVWPVYCLVVLVGAARTFANPAGQALFPNLVPPAHFANAIAINSSLWQTSTLIGPALGGVLYIFGPALVFAVALASFAGASLLIAAIRARGEMSRREKASWASVIAGFGFIRSKPVLLGAISLDLVAVLLGGATALLPIFAQDILMVGPWGLGLLRSMPAAGALCVSVLLAYRPLSRKSGRRMLQAVAVFGLATIGFGLSTNLYLSLACLFVLGMADMVSVFVRHTLVLSETPDAMRGRVSAVNSVFIGASNELGEFESGALAALIGTVPAVVAGGVATVATAAIWGRLFPQLRDRDSLVKRA
jgi:MFS family permease